jgi:hypothetical protein
MYELDEIKGVDIGETYRNEKQVVSFAHYIAKTEKQKLVDQINESKYISVICDGCTDIAAIEEDIAYVRTCYKGDIKTSFLAINNPDRADANCPHDGRDSRISGRLVDFYIY